MQSGGVCHPLQRCQLHTAVMFKCSDNFYVTVNYIITHGASHGKLQAVWKWFLHPRPTPTYSACVFSIVCARQPMWV